MHISFPFSFHSELLANHPASILKAEIKFVCVCVYVIWKRHKVFKNDNSEEIGVFSSVTEHEFKQNSAGCRNAFAGCMCQFWVQKVKKVVEKR